MTETPKEIATTRELRELADYPRPEATCTRLLALADALDALRQAVKPVREAFEVEIQWGEWAPDAVILEVHKLRPLFTAIATLTPSGDEP